MNAKSQSKPAATEGSETKPAKDGRGAFWASANYAGGLMQGLGMGLILAVIGVQIPARPLERFGVAVVLAGIVLLVFGEIRARKGR